MSHLPTLKAEYLVLRPFVSADAGQVQMLAGDYEIYRTTSNIPHPYEVDKAEQWISSHAKRFEAEQHLTLAITGAATGNVFGAVSLATNIKNKRAELGYWIGVPYWGKGYCTEAVQAVIEYGFKVLDLHKIKARHMAINQASGRVMQKAGMYQEAVLSDEILKDDVYHDTVVYGLINIIEVNVLYAHGQTLS